MAGIEVVRDAPKQGRVNRSPKHPFAIKAVPYVVQSFFIAPVLPGETMKNLLVQAKCETSLVSKPQGGWWFEMYFFYVKHRDLAERDLITQMHLDPSANISALGSAPASASTYFAGNGIDWVKKCRDRVVEEYFRDEGEAVATGPTAFSHNGLTHPIAAVGIDNWADSGILHGADMGAGDEQLPGEGAPGQTPGVPDDVPTGFESHWETWQNMRAMQLTDATFEDYIKSFGVRAPRELREDLHRPELIRYVRDWTYPAPSTQRYQSGSVNVGTEEDPVYEPVFGTKGGFAPRWAISERADKDRFFQEPGFIYGCMVVRPKAYFDQQAGAAVQMLDNAYSWLPAVLSDESYTSLKKVTAGAGVLPGAEEDWWFDAKDLFIHGDQFVYDGWPHAVSNMVTAPMVDEDGFHRRYPMREDVEAMFDPDLNDFQYSVDGVVQLTIASRLRDTSL